LICSLRQILSNILWLCSYFTDENFSFFHLQQNLF